MLKLKPRKRIDPNKIPKRSKPQEACCAFCKREIPRPELSEKMAGALIGNCPACDALFIDDSTGKLGGEAFVVGLTLMAGGDQERGMRLREGVDYEQRALVYDGRQHQVDPELDPSRYGVGRMWYFRKIS